MYRIVNRMTGEAIAGLGIFARYQDAFLARAGLSAANRIYAMIVEV